ncbi:MAG: hypothetical protein LPK80_01525 [Bacteroidota bacterium]|nr:hypothetical protein [Bacteroidota bacterium]MDX5428976.1 hypothetical protein [Bacteroidota bacterium]MDX5447524.1 hypothetical protein [Bacteroidota bacterium]MDX5506654.1 hypothetical protein [Bacteroidota bacterium]
MKRNSKSLLLSLLFLVSLILPGASFAQEGESSGIEGIEIAPKSIEVFSTEDIEMTARQALENDFDSVQGTVLNLGATNKKHWIKVELPALRQIETYYLLINYPLIDKMNVYDLSTGLPVLVDRTGQFEAFEERDYNYKNFLFPVRNFAGGNRKVILFEVSSGKQLLFPIELAPEQEVIRMNGRNNLISGFYTGVILVMLLYNLFIFTTTSDQNYLYYVIYIFFLGLTQAALQGFGDMFLWPDSAWLSLNATQLFGSLVGIASMVFVKFFLHLRRFLPKINLVFNILIFLDFIAFLLVLFGFQIFSYSLINAVAGIASILGTVAAVILTRQGNRTATFFLVAWSTFIAGIIIYVLKDYGLVPYTPFTNSALLIGSGAEVVLLSFALADKINTYRSRMQESQTRALEALRENERIVREQNVILERKVEERTFDLKKANDELSQALRELREAQGQLVEAEKMASLGQLTAGIAHEINNPVNFISSNITPIKNDVEDLFDAFFSLEKFIQESGNEDLIQKAKDLKEEMDVDYAHEEVNLLLKGMKDGVDRTVEIVRGLRVFTRLDEAVFKPVDLHEGIDSTLILLNNKLKNKVEVVKEYDEIPEVECYGGKMNQVFMNLIVNAVQAFDDHPNDKIQPTITIGTKSLGEKVRISISDNGPGIPDSIKDKIFDPFFTTKPVGKGTGLGLSIVYQIIDAHGGDLEVKSIEGKGTEFIITLPVQNKPD